MHLGSGSGDAAKLQYLAIILTETCWQFPYAGSLAIGSFVAVLVNPVAISYAKGIFQIPLSSYLWLKRSRRRAEKSYNSAFFTDMI